MQLIILKKKRNNFTLLTPIEEKHTHNQSRTKTIIRKTVKEKAQLTHRDAETHTFAHKGILSNTNCPQKCIPTLRL